MASDVSKSETLKQSWCTSAFASLQEFFAKFAPEIVQLQKQNLRAVVVSHQAKKHAEWQHAQDFLVRQSASLTMEEKELLEDWQFILCDMSTLESVALLSGLQRCFQRVDSFLNEHAEVLKKIAAKNLDTALRRRAMAQYPLSTFSRLFLERYEEQLTTEQRKAMSIWKETLCGQSAVSASEQEAITAKRRAAVLDIQKFFAKFAAEIVGLQKENLKSVVTSSSSNKHADWKQAQNFFVRHYEFLSVEEQDQLQDWELVLCDVSRLESVALLPGLQRCFQRVDAFLNEHAEALKKIGAKNLHTALRSRHMAQFPMSTFTRLFLEKFEKQLATEQVEALSRWQGHLCVLSAAEQETITAKREKAVSDIQEFCVKFALEIVELQKTDLRGVVMSSQAKKHVEWKRAQNCFVFLSASLTLEEKDFLQDWELVLCDVSRLESVALLPGLQRCFQRVDAFLNEHAEALKKIRAKNLHTALRSRHMAQFPMSTFTRLFLEKFEKQLATEQVEALSRWQGHLCVLSAAEQETITAKREKAVSDIQEFCVKFALEIVELQKTDLRGVVMSSQAKKHVEWKRAQNCFVFLSDSLTLEEKDQLQDWELVLCDVSRLESVALLPGLQRCFQRVDAFLNEHAEALKKIRAKNLHTALRSRHMAQFPMSTFTRLFLEKFEKQLATEQAEALSTWQEHLCALSAAEQEAITAKRRAAVLDIQKFFAKFAAEIVGLQKENLKSVVTSSSSNKHADWKQAQNFFVRHYEFLSVEEQDQLQDWELVLCDVSRLESVALLPGLQRCFQRVDAFLNEHAEALKKIGAKNLHTALRSRHMAQFPMSTFTRVFLERYEEQLATEQVEALSTWQERLCVLSAAEQEAIRAKRKKAVLDIQEFFAKFAADIVELQKENLRSLLS